jgi:hypothetical protein
VTAAFPVNAPRRPLMVKRQCFIVQVTRGLSGPTLGERQMDDQVVLRHKGLGIASFVIAIVVLVLVFLLFLIAGVMKTSGAATPTANAVIGSLIFLLWLIDVVGVAIGIAGVMDRTAKKTFPVLGIVIGGAVLVLSIILIVIGLKFGS